MALREPEVPLDGLLAMPDSDSDSEVAPPPVKAPKRKKKPKQAEMAPMPSPPPPRRIPAPAPAPVLAPTPSPPPPRRIPAPALAPVPSPASSQASRTSLPNSPTIELEPAPSAQECFWGVFDEFLLSTDDANVFSGPDDVLNVPTGVPGDFNMDDINRIIEGSEVTADVRPAPRACFTDGPFQVNRAVGVNGWTTEGTLSRILNY
jgi:hypothetical protein